MAFFSICIPVHNRGNTIFNTLCSVAIQQFRDFDLIIVDNYSTDNSIEEIERFFNSNIFLENNFKYKFIKLLKYLPDTIDWNEPIKYAESKYIVMLEGDDQFKENHLKRAYEILSKNGNIGIFSTGNQLKKRSLNGFITSIEYYKYIYSLQEVPPPSEVIFIAYNKKLEKNLYNVTDYIYAPEIELYLRLAEDGYDIFHDNQQNVIRDLSKKDKFNWKYFSDQFSIIDKYRSKVTKELYIKSKYHISKDAVRSYLIGKILRKSDIKLFKNDIINKIGYIKFYLFYLHSFFDLLKNQLYRILPWYGID